MGAGVGARRQNDRQRRERPRSLPPRHPPCFAPWYSSGELLQAKLDAGDSPIRRRHDTVPTITPHFRPFAASLRLLLCHTPIPSIFGRGRMEYLGFVVEAFEQGPGKWRAKILRSSGKPLITGRKRIWQFVTGVDATTAPAALLMALEAIDAGTFSSRGAVAGKILAPPWPAFESAGIGRPRRPSGKPALKSASEQKRSRK